MVPQWLCRFFSFSDSCCFFLSCFTSLHIRSKFFLYFTTFIWQVTLQIKVSTDWTWRAHDVARNEASTSWSCTVCCGLGEVELCGDKVTVKAMSVCKLIHPQPTAGHSPQSTACLEAFPLHVWVRSLCIYPWKKSRLYHFCLTTVHVFICCKKWSKTHMLLYPKTEQVHLPFVVLRGIS